MKAPECCVVCYLLHFHLTYHSYNPSLARRNQKKESIKRYGKTEPCSTLKGKNQHISTPTKTLNSSDPSI